MWMYLIYTKKKYTPSFQAQKIKWNQIKRKKHTAEIHDWVWALRGIVSLKEGQNNDKMAWHTKKATNKNIDRK